MKTINRQIFEYGESLHQKTSKAIHWVSIPILILSAIGLLWAIPSSNLRFALGTGPFNNWASITLVLVVIYYFFVYVPFGFGMALFGFFCLRLVRLAELYQEIPIWTLSLGLLIVALAGHFYIYKRSGVNPYLVSLFQFIWLGPAWAMHLLFKKIGMSH